MVLRFQKDNDEVDLAAKRERGGIIAIFVIIAIFSGADAWLRGRPLHSFLQDMGIMCFFGWAVWIVSRVYYEFRIRTKEIHGMVAQIAQTVAALQERANALENELRSPR